MINVRAMKESDIDALNLDEWIKERYMSYVKTDNPMVVLEDENGLLCAFGGSFYWQGVCEVWFKLVRKEKIKAQMRILKQILKEQSEKLKVRRLFATTKCEYKTGQRFLEYLGFEKEGVLRKFQPDGSDSMMFSRIFNV